MLKSDHYVLWCRPTIRGVSGLDAGKTCNSRPANTPLAERPSMTLTVADVSPIMSLMAGVLILIMPRLLNLIVAIFLILNGLIGLGLLKWLHIEDFSTTSAGFAACARPLKMV